MPETTVDDLQQNTPIELMLIGSWLDQDNQSKAKHRDAQSSPSDPWQMVFEDIEENKGRADELKEASNDLILDPNRYHIPTVTLGNQLLRYLKDQDGDFVARKLVEACGSPAIPSGEDAPYNVFWGLHTTTDEYSKTNPTEFDNRNLCLGEAGPRSVSSKIPVGSEDKS